jgi:hypothetical protein
MSKIYTLKDGTQLELSTRSTNRSGYTGAALSPTWTMDPYRPFLAACSNPPDPSVMRQLRAQDRTAWHGGCYADAREAAYVVGLFREDPVKIDQLIGQHGAWDQFPADLYDLPIVASADDARRFLAETTAKKKAVSIRKLPTKKLSTPEAFWQKYDRTYMQLLIDKFGRNMVEHSLKNLTLSEFEARFGLARAA